MTYHGNEEFTADFFDKASTSWIANKKKLNDCTYVYKCIHICASGKPCTRKAYGIYNMLCKGHAKYATKNHQ